MRHADSAQLTLWVDERDGARSATPAINTFVHALADAAASAESRTVGISAVGRNSRRQQIRHGQFRGFGRHDADTIQLTIIGEHVEEAVIIACR